MVGLDNNKDQHSAFGWCYPCWTLRSDLLLLSSQVGKQMILGTLEDVFKSEMLYSLSRLVSKSIILFRDQVMQAMSVFPANSVACYSVMALCSCCNKHIFVFVQISHEVLLEVMFANCNIQWARINFSDIWFQTSNGHPIFPFPNIISFLYFIL